MQFVCELPSEAYDFTWLINGKAALQIGQEHLSYKGIVYDSAIVVKDNRTFTTISIEPKPENEITRFICVAHLLLTVSSPSAEVVFRVQGEEYAVICIHSLQCIVVFNHCRSAGTST